MTTETTNKSRNLSIALPVEKYGHPRKKNTSVSITVESAYHCRNVLTRVDGIRDYST